MCRFLISLRMSLIVFLVYEVMHLNYRKSNSVENYEVPQKPAI